MNFIDRLHKLFAPLVNPQEEQLKLALEALQANPSEVAPHLVEPDGCIPYGRNVLLRTDDVEVVLIHLPAGAKSLPHNHGDSFGCEIVVEGELTNLLYQTGDDGRLHDAGKEVYPSNSLVYVPKDQIHAIENATKKRVVTLNVYTPPLAACQQYAPEEPAQKEADRVKNARFNELFDQWASSYDETVYDSQGEYQEVFAGYDRILAAVVGQIPLGSRTVLEIGPGTGNLSRLLTRGGYHVIGVEPSPLMREQLKRKGIEIDLRDGHFLSLPLLKHEKVDAVVSTFAFHHLPLEEKREAIRLLQSHLSDRSGRIIIADTCFIDEASKQKMIERAKRNHQHNVLHDLLTEYYELHEDLRTVFQKNGMDVSFSQLNNYAWLIVATYPEAKQ
ncbi:methyltransferase domain-containing protein [Brevibacillus migulae]|uniref:methyltransferase domain-containing protein n=1 Tax=Brevibacillus migulae TaxID=1644114 RepID=UPI00106E4369|nr:methyltransferase domain-containing protein [Brevibacillus migulae]